MPLQRTEGPVYKPPSKRDPSEVRIHSALQQNVQLSLQAPPPQKKAVLETAYDPKKNKKRDLKKDAKKPKHVDAKPKKKPGTEDRPPPPWSLAGFTISPEDIAKFEANPESMKSYGGIRGVTVCLRVDPAKGIEGSPDDIALRTKAFGPNSYPVKKPKIFLVSFLNSVNLGL